MARALPVNVLVEDQFMVRTADGFGQVSGLVQGDFSVGIYKDGAEQILHPYAITEIGSTGEYSFNFTPDAAGFWLVAVQYLDQPWQGEYDVSLYTLSDLRELILIGNALEHDNAVVDQQVFGHVHVGQKYLTAARIRAYDTKANAEAAGLTGLLHTFTLTATYSSGEQTLFRIVREP